MFDILRAWLAFRGRGSAFPSGPTVFPARFRGRPQLEVSPSTDGVALVSAVPTGAVRATTRGLPVLDAGACLFSPEEAQESDGSSVRFTRDIRMATRLREDLITEDGQVTLAEAFDRRTQQLFGRSLRLRSVVAGSCGGCEAELIATSNIVFDLARFGVQFVASPRHADGLLITGVVNRNMADALQQTYDAVGDPRVVIAVGACAIGGGPFRDSDAVAGIPIGIPVDLWIPGCPPHPLTVLDGLLRLLGRLEDGGANRG